MDLGPSYNLDKKHVCPSDPASSHQILTKIYYVVDTLKTDLNWRWQDFKQGFPFGAQEGEHPSSVKKWPNSPIKVPSPYFHFLPIKVLAPPFVTEIGCQSLKKRSLKSWTTKWVIFQRNLKIFSACGVHFYTNWQFMTTKAYHTIPNGKSLLFLQKLYTSF